MEKVFFDKTDVVRALGKVIRNLPVGETATVVVTREKFAEFLVSVAHALQE